MPARKTKKRKTLFPLVKMVEFVCATVDAAREAVASTEANVPSTPKSVDEATEPTIGSSTALLAVIQVAQFLTGENSLTVTQSRALCKFMGSQDIEISGGDRVHLRKLKEQMEELGMMLTDGPSLRAIASLNESLADVESDNEEGGESGAEERSLNDASSEGTVTDDEIEDPVDSGSTGETTVEDSLMDSMAALSVKNKENVARVGKSQKQSRRSRRSDGSVSVLESLGSPAGVN
jgi:hypothetical protein